MNKRNLHKELCDFINSHKDDVERKKLLLHVCCAPCSTHCLIFLRQYFSLGIFFYNPNIDNKKEYYYRLNEMKKLTDILNKGLNEDDKEYISLYEGVYEPDRYHKLVKGHENDFEGGERCGICFELRLDEAAKKTAQLGYEYFTTSLSISPMKNAQLLCDIGEKVSEKYGVKYLPGDFKKNNGYLNSVNLSKEFDLYRQDYCGCSFSKAEREKYKNNC